MHFCWEGSDISHLLLGCVCIWKTKFMSNAIIMNLIPYRKINSNVTSHGHNGSHMHKNNAANIAIALGSKTESLHYTSE